MAAKDGSGIVFDSSTGFRLPNGAERSPDVAWVRRTRWDALSQVERERFPPLCPDFVVELRSPSDDLDELPEKMQEYIDNGAPLGWLIDPMSKVVWVYRPGADAARLEQPKALLGESTLPGLVIELSAIW